MPVEIKKEQEFTTSRDYQGNPILGWESYKFNGL